MTTYLYRSVPPISLARGSVQTAPGIGSAGGRISGGLTRVTSGPVLNRPIQATPGMATASSIRSGYTIDSFFTGTQGIFGSMLAGEFLLIDFRSPTIGVNYSVSGGPGAQWAPATHWMQRSTNLSDWETVVVTSYGASVPIAIPSTAAPARYWRLYQPVNTQGYPSAGYEWHFLFAMNGLTF